MKQKTYLECPCGAFFIFIPAPNSCRNDKCPACGNSVEDMAHISAFDVPFGETVMDIRDPAEIWNAQVIQFPLSK